MDQDQRFRELFSLWLDNKINEAQFAELQQLYRAAHRHDEVIAILKERWATPSGQAVYSELQLDEMLAGITGNGSGKARVRRLAGMRVRWIRYAAALVVLVAGVYLVSRMLPAKELATAGDTAVSPVQNDVLPGGDKATLTLADGTTIILDSAGNGRLALEDGSQILKKDGEIVYFSDNAATGPGNNGRPAYNTMSTPRGGLYHLVLPDGSRVWLNAASSITYPVRFSGSERRVRISGEVYFEVAKNPRMPFRVGINEETVVEVIGTQFNINAYPGESFIKTSLVEGAIRVHDQVLLPGQAYIDGKIVPTDIQQDISWKNRVFNFNDADLQTVMKQLERWYDVEVIYPRNIPQMEFWGEIGMNLRLSQVLEILEKSEVKFRIGEGKKLIVIP